MLRDAIAEGETIRTVATGASNTVTAITSDGVFVETSKSREADTGPQLVPAWMIELGFATLRGRGSLSQQTLLNELNVKRSAAVIAILARLPNVEVAASRPTLLRMSSSAAVTPIRRTVEPEPFAEVQVVRPAQPDGSRSKRIGLVGCAKTKRSVPSRAEDLYTSPLFLGRRRYVERTCDEWFILSAKHGVLSVDDVVEPYDVTLNAASIPERRDWSRGVVADLRSRLGDLQAFEFEIHAGANYRDFGVVEGLRSQGAAVTVPAAGLNQGEQLAFYKRGPKRTIAAPSVSAVRVELDASAIEVVAAELSDPSRAVSASLFPQDAEVASHPGLYSWWADDTALELLGAALSDALPPLIYAGQAGATTRQQQVERQATLASRIGRNHLRGNIGSSTFRKTLASLLMKQLVLRLAAPGVLDDLSNERLTEWMCEHLSIAIAPWPDRSSLADLEEAVLHVLDPPLNLTGMPSTPIRFRLRNLRRAIS